MAQHHPEGSYYLVFVYNALLLFSSAGMQLISKADLSHLRIWQQLKVADKHCLFSDGVLSISAQVFTLSALEVFHEDEMEVLLCGAGEHWSPQQLADSMKFDHGYTAQSTPVRWVQGNCSATIRVWTVCCHCLWYYSADDVADASTA